MSSRSPEPRAPRAIGESLLPEERLRKRADFLRCYEQGRRLYGRLVTVYVLRRPEASEPPRLGITVTRKVGKAVVRQRLKRRIREVYRRWDRRRRLPAVDLLVHVKPAAREADFATLQREIQRLLLPLTESSSSPG